MEINKNKIIRLIILLASLSVIIASSGKILSYDLNQINHKSQKISDKIPEGLDFVYEISEDFSHIIHDTISDRYKVYNNSGELDFFVLLSSPYCDDIRGWGGSVPFALLVDNNDKIIKMHLLPNHETPSWINGLKEKNFFNKWDGLTLEEAQEKEVDAVSGSTITSEAIIQSMDRRLAIYSKIDQKEKKNDIKDILWTLISLIVVVFALISFLYPKNLGKYRIWLLFASVGVLGFWQANFLSMALLTNWLINGMNPFSHLALFVVLVLSIVLPLFTNKSFYCQYVCPYGAAQELVGKISKQNIKITNSVVKILNPVKYILLLIIVLIVVLKIDVALEDFEPFSAFQFQFASLTVLILAIVMLILSLFNNKPWCKYFCPTGALLSLLRGKKGKINTTKTVTLLLVLTILYSSLIFGTFRFGEV